MTDLWSFGRGAIASDGRSPFSEAADLPAEVVFSHRRRSPHAPHHTCHG